MNASVTSVYAALALVFAALGLYGLLAYSVLQRRREIAVRLAVGAQPGSLLRMVIGRGLTLVASGLVLGLIAAFAITRVLSSSLYGVKSSDPLTFLGVAALFLAIALLATYLPARGATRIEPVRALRLE